MVMIGAYQDIEKVVRQWILIISNRYLLLYQPLTIRHARPLGGAALRQMISGSTSIIVPNIRFLVTSGVVAPTG